MARANAKELPEPTLFSARRCRLGRPPSKRSTTASGDGGLTRYIDDGSLPADNNWAENQIRRIAIGRSNWLFAGSCGPANAPLR
jgi:hypothetical protein